MSGQPMISRTSVACLLMAFLSLALAFVNTRPSTQTGLVLTLLVGLVSLALAALGVRDIWRNWGQLFGLAYLVPGVGVALLSMYFAWGSYTISVYETRYVSVANNLRRLALAMFAYEEAQGILPPAAVYNENGKPLLSWRVLVLPYLEREDLAERGLFQQFKLDEPWDSTHNLPLLAKMPRVYAPLAGVSVPDPYTTFYRVFAGHGAAFEGREGVRLTDFPDGAAKTLLLVEAAGAVPWTKPEELAYASEGPLPKLGGTFRKGFHVVFADGHVAYLTHEEIDETTLRALVTRNGGETIVPDF